jgi:hypothetical protein
MPKPFRVRVGEERHALALAHELAGLATIEVRRNSHTWEISIGGAPTKRLVVSTLEAIRRTLSGQPSATAEVHLDGDTYQMHGE